MRKLQNWLAAYADFMSLSEAPDSFHLWIGVSIIAGALQRKVVIDQKSFQWTPNFYIVLVAPPGVATKSTAMRTGFALLREVKGIHFGPQSLTWQGLLKALNEAKVGIPTTSDTSPLAERDYMSCLTCDVSELGTFLKPRDPDLIDFLTDMWDGQKGVWKRSLSTMETVELENPWLNVIGCTTPGWIMDNFSSSLIHGGLTSRCVFVWGNKKRRLIAYPAEMEESREWEGKREILIHDLAEIAKLKGNMKLDREAIEWGRDWYEKHWTSKPKHLDDERYSGYIARKQTHIHKVAIVISVALGDSLSITKEMLELSDQLVTAQERDMLTIFNSITDTEIAKNQDLLLSWIRRHKSIAKITLFQKVMRQMSEQEFLATLEALKNAEYIEATTNQKGTSYSIAKMVED